MSKRLTGLANLAHLAAVASVSCVMAFVIGTAISPAEPTESARDVEFDLVDGAQRNQAQPRSNPESTDVESAWQTLVVVSSSADPIPGYERPEATDEPVFSVPIGPAGDTTFLAVEPLHELNREWEEHTKGGRWIEVYLPIRPNGSTGWIRLEQTELFSNAFRIEVSRDDFSMRIFEADELILESDVAIGTGDTPTPEGRFFTTELIKTVDPEGPYGPYAFAISGFSETIFEFNGGPGIIGVHGTNDPSALGTEVSFGCVRIPNDIIEYMASTIPLGTPIEIT